MRSFPQPVCTAATDTVVEPCEMKKYAAMDEDETSQEKMLLKTFIQTG